jgi:hypothetical protein
MQFSHASVKRSESEIMIVWSPDCLIYIATGNFLCSMRPSKGVRIEEMGYKFGCNGVDNAKLWFNNVC